MDALRPDAHARTHCRQCGAHITGDERYYTLTVPFGPVIGVEHETCPPKPDRHLADGELGYWRECYHDQLARANEAEAKAERLRTKLEAACRERDEAYTERAVLVGKPAFDEDRHG